MSVSLSTGIITFIDYSFLGTIERKVLGTKSPGTCNFLLVINTNLPPILHRFRDIAFDTSKIAVFGYPSFFLLRLIPRLRGSLHHILVSDISIKTKGFGLHLCRRKFGHIFNHFYAVCPKAADFAEMTQNNSHYAVQGHSRSPILVSIESSYATSYQ